VEIQEKDGVFYVSGDITEACDLSSANLPAGDVKFDMGGIRSINSCGVREWITWINKLGIKAMYSNCTQAVVMQFNMVREFLGNGARVESFQVPAFCECCGQQKVFLLRSGIEFHPGQRVAFEVPKCGEEGCDIEADVDYESYFYFVEELEG